MIENVKCFDSNKTISFKVTDKKLLKNILKYGKKSAIQWIQNVIVNLFMAIMINTYKDKNKYIHSDKVNTNFQRKKSVKRKCIIQMSIISNIRFCY